MMTLLRLAAFFFGAIGSLFNIGLSGLLCTKSLSRTVAVFRICLHISAVHGIITSLTVILIQFTHVYCNGYYLHVSASWVKNALPAWFRNSWYVFGTMLITAMWQLPPAPCILQYILLSSGLTSERRTHSARSIVLVSYAPSIVMMLICGIWAVDFIPTPAFDLKISTVVRKLYDLNHNETVVVYGLSYDRDPDNNNRSLLSLGCLLTLLSYFVSYTIFFGVLRKMRTLLQQSVMSDRTRQLQRRFIQMQLVQGLAPLLMLAIPYFIFILCMILKFEDMGALSPIQTIGCYAMPTVQSVAHIHFVIHASRGKRPQKKTVKSPTTVNGSSSTLL